MLAQIAADIYGSSEPDIPVNKAMADMVGAHYEAMLDFYGADLGVRVSRKHLGWYMDVAQTDPALRRQIQTSHDPKQVLALLPEAFDTPTKKDAA